MALYSFNLSHLSRRKGMSACDKCNYQDGIPIYDKFYGVTRNRYSDRNDVLHTEIILPPNVLSELKDRSTLWSKAEFAEGISSVARVASIIIVALQREFSLAENIELVEMFANNKFVKYGRGVDYAIHDKGDGNPHSHIMVTTRFLTPYGCGEKCNEFNKSKYLIEWREYWAEINNRKFMEKNMDIRISHECYAIQDINKPYQRQPTAHIGKKAKDFETRCGIKTEKTIENEKILKHNYKLIHPKEQNLDHGKSR